MRNDIFSIIKAISIACIVISISGIDAHYASLLASIALPPFFISAGYFFHPNADAQGRGFMTRRIEKVYFPFVRWSLIFLVFHNLLVLCSIVNGDYYGWHEFAQRLWDIVTCMSGYDEALLPTYWFFRTFFLSGLMFWIISEVARKAFPMYSLLKCSLSIAGLCFVIIVWGICGDLSVGILPYGGIREVYGVLLFSLGYGFRFYERAGGKIVNIYTFILSALLISLWFIFGKASLPILGNTQTNVGWLIAEIFAAVSFFIFVAYLAALIKKLGGFPKTTLAYVGERTLYIFAFSPIAFKVAAMVTAMLDGLPWKYVSSVSTASVAQSSMAVILNVAFGMGLPLAWMAVYKKVAQKVDLSIRSRFLWSLRMLISLVVLIFIGFKKLAIYIYGLGKGIVNGFVEIIKASNPKDE